MSIILDALKKSENERRRQDRPGLADLPMAMPRPQAPAWLLVMVGALVSLLLVLGLAYWSQGNGMARQPVVVTAPPTPAADDSAQRVMESFPRETAVRPPRPPPDEVRPLSREVAAAAPAPAQRARPSASASPAAGSGSSAPGSAASVITSGLPSAEELAASGELTLPDLHLDLHVYDADSAQRLVFINGQRLRQGDEFAGGVRVAEIVPDGVVLQQGTTRFVLSRD